MARIQDGKKILIRYRVIIFVIELLENLYDRSIYTDTHKVLIHRVTIGKLEFLRALQQNVRVLFDLLITYIIRVERLQNRNQERKSNVAFAYRFVSQDCKAESTQFLSGKGCVQLISLPQTYAKSIPSIV